MDFRVEERDWWHLEHLWRQENRKWRLEDIEQRVLENARWVWLRYAEKNRRDVEEKSEQLKSISNLSALIGGFAVVAFVELQFHDPETRPSQSEALITAYAATTALTVGLMLNSMVLCSFMLCSILRNGKTYVSEDEEAEYLYRCRRFALEFTSGDKPPLPKRSFERHWETRCEDDWRHAFRMFTCGVPVFMVNIACMAWLKFNYSYAAAGTATAVAVCATAGWARTQMNWGWHISRRYHGRGNHPGVRGGGGGRDRGCGLPFDWHARPDAVVKQPSGAGGAAAAAGAPPTPPSNANAHGGLNNPFDDDARRGPGLDAEDDADDDDDVASPEEVELERSLGLDDLTARRIASATDRAASTTSPAAGVGAGAGLPPPVRPRAEWGDARESLDRASRTSEEVKFVERTSPTARDVAARRERRASEEKTDACGGGAGGDPFEAAAAALSESARREEAEESARASLGVAQGESWNTFGGGGGGVGGAK